jgi:hypothetical protein
VHDPRALRLGAPCGTQREQPVDESAAGMSGGRVDHDPSRLVDDEEVLVLVGDGQVELLRLELGRLLGRQVDLERLAACEAVALRRRGAVDPDGAGVDQPLSGAAGRDLGQPGEEAIEALTGGLVRNASSERL